MQVSQFYRNTNANSENIPTQFWVRFHLVITAQFTGLHSRAAGPYRDGGTCFPQFLYLQNPIPTRGSRLGPSPQSCPHQYFRRSGAPVLHFELLAVPPQHWIKLAFDFMISHRILKPNLDTKAKIFFQHPALICQVEQGFEISRIKAD